MSVLDTDIRVESLTVLSGFRAEFYTCLTARADALFEATDALLCTDSPVKTLVGLTLAPEHRRGHGALYDGLACGGIDVRRFRTTLAGLPLPRGGDGRITLAADISPWPRPDAETSAERLHCHHPCRCDGIRQTIPGWPYSILAALEPGRTSWTAVLDAQRIGPEDDETHLTAEQLRDLIGRLRKAGHWRPGDLPILIVFDAGYDVTRLAWLLADLPVELLGRLRADRVFRFPASPRQPRTNGRPARHGAEFRFADASSHPQPAVATTTLTTRYGTALAQAWDRLHPRLTHRAGWEEHPGQLPIIEGAVIRLTVQRLPGERHPKPVGLWWSATGGAPADVDRLWRSFLRRFDLEHTFRFFKQQLGWTCPKIRTPAAGDRWTWLVIAAHTQLRLVRYLADDLRRPWERPAVLGRMTPGRVRRGFRHIRAKTILPAGAPKPGRPGPGRPRGSKNTVVAARHLVGKRHETETSPAKKIN